MTVVAALRARLDRRRLRERIASYSAAASDAERAAAQLALLNASWERTADTVPYWAERVRTGELPRRFASLEELSRRVPVTDRATLQREGSRMESSERPPELARITGGSTAEPVQIASWRSEFDFTRFDMWIARAWYGLAPDARLFLLWGHSHLLGSGWRGWLNARRRELSDRLLGYRRFSAYDLGREALRRAGEEVVRFRPDYVIGYSVALDLFAAANADRRDALRAAGVRALLAAAEGFPAPDSEQRLSDLFACPVGMEYGAVETGLVGHTHPDGGYRVFWRTYLVDAERVGTHHRLRVTSLYPRRTPLVRYELGDEIDPGAGSPDLVPSVFRFDRVIGRCNDFVVLDDGFAAHSEVFTHAVRACSAIRSYQVVQEASALRIVYTAERDLASGEQADIRERLARVHASLGSISIERADAPIRTVAGKTPMVIRR